MGDHRLSLPPELRDARRRDYDARRATPPPMTTAQWLREKAAQERSRARDDAKARVLLRRSY